MLKRWSIAVAVAAITLFGALLRLDALTVKYGWLDHPAWAVRLERTLLPISRELRPGAVPWGHVDRPYVGGDPNNYLRFAREMRHFYQAHVREPVFLAWTRALLWVMRGSDIAVSYASATAGTLAIVATFLLGAAVWSRAAGLVAAAALAIELDAVTWSVDGWRDDTFMLFTALSAWAFIRLLQRPTRGWAVTAGVIAAAACLTRISALSFVLPALLWIPFEARRGQLQSQAPVLGALSWHPRVAARLWARHAAWAAVVAGLITTVLIAPFLINCWRVTGDPFFAINYHTRYYRAAEGLPPDESQGALAYVGQKLVNRPIATIDTAGQGLLVYPFTNKWSGFTPWSPHLATMLRWFAAAGLILAFWYPEGRFVWVLLVTSLVPYAVTWPLGGGGEWRFTQHVYPFYLVAAGSALAAAAAAIRGAVTLRREWGRRMAGRLRLRPVLACTLLIAGGWLLYVTLPYLVVYEALAAGESASIAVSDRDYVFFGSRWSEPNGEANVVVRVATADRVSIRLPLPREVDHLLTLRMDAPQVANAAYQPRVTVFLDNRAIGRVRFDNNPARVGTYRFTIPRALAGRSVARLHLVASHTVRADKSGPRFAWLPGDTPVAFYLWYARVEPIVGTPRTSRPEPHKRYASAQLRE